MAKKLSKGRQKIELKKIENDEDRLITFSKRRSGIYKKATEISALCGVEVGVLVFSPSGKAFTYGVPNLQAVADRLLHPNNNNNSSGSSSNNNIMINITSSSRSSNIFDTKSHYKKMIRGSDIDHQMNSSYDELSAELERLKKEGEGLSSMRKGIEDCCWWDTVVEDLNKHEVEQFTVSMEELGRTADYRLHQLNNIKVARHVSNSSSILSSSPVLAPLEVAGSSSSRNYCMMLPTEGSISLSSNSNASPAPIDPTST